MLLTYLSFSLPILFNFAFPATPHTCHPVVSIDFAKGFSGCETLQLDSSAVT